MISMRIFRIPCYLMPLFVLFAAGCGSEKPEIVTYDAPRADPRPRFDLNAIARQGMSNMPGQGAPASAGPQLRGKLLGAIFPQPQSAYFFKILGLQADVAPLVESFSAFVASVRFQDGKPVWTLPSGWKELPGDAVAAAKFEIPVGDDKVEMTLTSLPAIEDTEEMVLQNVNRWRGQVSLSPVKAPQLYESKSRLEEVHKMKLGENEVVLVNLTGDLAPPFAARFAKAAARKAGAASSTVPLTYDLPPTWKPAQLRRFSLLTFKAVEEQEEVVITVSRMGGDAGGLVMNINRWRDQVQLPAQSANEILSGVKKVEVSGEEGRLSEFSTASGAKSPQKLVGVMVPHGGETWVFKMSGDAKLFDRERGRFDEYLKSVKFTK